ncbi:MAG TPA: SUMF1/EgtB/PvdO family nonheme iron enzyme, partial [Urbifossiella sp.]|nr:SUMF1/EgtB/PvdO family nonheme iron enzyme [Urbifossiella sp.]
MKVLAPQLAASGAARTRFEREARSAAAVRDEHVVNVYAVSEPGDPLPYLVMELVAGQTLQAKIDKAGPLPPKEVLRIGSQIARGLAAAHKQGLIHRDIKPANILLENGVERVKVTDFGLARAADDASLSQSGVVAGTPMYMSPEQARGDTLDTRSDLFSLGSVLYVLCTGRPPFRADSTLAVLKRVVEDDPRPVRDVNPEVPRWLADVVAKLHAKAPADRFQTAQEVADLLSGYLSELQQQGTVVSRVAPPKPVAARTGWGWWFAAALILVGVLTAGGVLGQSDPPEPRRAVHFDLAIAFAMFGLLALVPTAALLTFSRRWGARGLGVAGAGLLGSAANGGLGLLSPVVVSAPPQPAVLTLRLSNTAMQYRVDGTGPHMTGVSVVEVPLEPGEHWVWFQLADRAYQTAKFRLEPGARNELVVTAAVGGFATATLDGTPVGVAGGPGLPPTRALQAPFDAATARDAQEAWAKQLGVPVEFTHPSGPTFRLIPPGEYGMGFTDAELAAVRTSLQALPNVGDYQRFAAASSGPRHTVRITRPFYLAKHETTAGQFRRFVEAAKHTPTGTVDWQSFVTPGQEEKQPVVGVSWADAEAFCRWLGPGYELPSEAQWEYAARGGAPGLWSFGNDPTKLLDHAVVGQAWPKPEPVGLKAPNPFGLFDVHGGADEWCRDWHVRDFYRRSPIDDPVNLEEPTDPNTGRASRGGSWNAAAVYSQVAFRAFDHPTRPNLPKGFRVALTGDLKAAVDAAARGSAEPGFVSLFNGRDLTGWKAHPDQPGGWRVDAG